jgi:serralysin
VELRRGRHAITATLDHRSTIADGPRDVPDAGVRSPDNLVWATDGFIYVQEDRSTSPGLPLRQHVTGAEASHLAARTRPPAPPAASLEVDRDGRPCRSAPPTSAPASIGNWETSGILDVTDLFATRSR